MIKSIHITIFAILISLTAKESYATEEIEENLKLNDKNFESFFYQILSEIEEENKRNNLISKYQSVVNLSELFMTQDEILDNQIVLKISSNKTIESLQIEELASALLLYSSFDNMHDIIRYANQTLKLFWTPTIVTYLGKYSDTIKIMALIVNIAYGIESKISHLSKLNHTQPSLNLINFTSTLIFIGATGCIVKYFSLSDESYYDAAIGFTVLFGALWTTRVLNQNYNHRKANLDS